MATGGANFKRSKAYLGVNLDDVELLVRVRYDDATAERYNNIVIRCTDPSPGGFPGPTHGYFFRANHGGTIQLTRVVSSTETDLDTGVWTPDTNAHWVRLRAVGTTIQARFWPDGDPEPGTWTLEATDANIASGDVGLVFVNGGSTTTRTAFFDDLTVTEVV